MLLTRKGGNMICRNMSRMICPLVLTIFPILLDASNVGLCTNAISELIRTSHRAPSGWNRLGLGSFSNFSFGSTTNEIHSCEIVSVLDRDGKCIITVEMSEAYYGFSLAQLCFGNTNRLCQIVLEDVIPPHITSAAIATRIRAITEDLTYRFRTSFIKEVGDLKLSHVISRHRNNDSEFPISIVLSRSGHGKTLSLTIESVGAMRSTRKDMYLPRYKEDINVDVEI